MKTGAASTAVKMVRERNGEDGEGEKKLSVLESEGGKR